MNNTNATKELSYYEKNKEAYLKKCRNYYQANRDTIIIRRREWNKSNRSIISVRTRLYRESRTAEQKEQRKVKYNIWLKKKMSTDPGFKLSRYLRSSLGAELKKRNAYKADRAIILTGCTISELVKYIESLWLPGMNWDNHTKNGWHIDHIKPIDTFDLTDYEQQRVCFHYSNLRPLWASDNLSRPKDGSDIVVDNFII